LKLHNAACVFLGLVTIIQPAMSAPVLYAGAGNFGTAVDGSILILDQSTGAGTLLGTPSTLGITGLAFDSLGDLYATTVKNGITLEKIDPNTGLQLSSIALSTGIGDLSFQPLTDVLFGISQGGVLYTINVSTGTETLVGDTTTGRTGGLAFAPDGTLYLAGLDRSPQNTTGFALMTLNPATGAITHSVSISVFYDGLGIRPSDGVIFGDTAGNVGDFIETIDPTTGIETFLGSTTISKVSDLAFQAVPEPASWSMLGAGAIGLMLWARQRLI
jgi:WD40 repeat protein